VSWLRRGPLLALVVAAVAGAVIWLARPDDATPRRALDPVAVSSDAPRRSSLAELAAASDLVVRGQVTDTAHGRVFGDPGSTATIESRTLTLRIDRVLRGAAPDDDRVLVEEEGWDGDGAPVVVDGAAPSRRGDAGIWFLAEVGEAEEHRYVVVSAEGRYLVQGGHLVGAAGEDPLIAHLEDLGPDGLAAAIAALP
jgi:hypothetical protein